jgi:hypothetical protein
LALDAENPVRLLPAIAELSADRAAARIVAAFAHGRIDRDAKHVDDIPTGMGEAAAAVDAGIDAGPVVDENGSQRRLVEREIGGTGGRGCAECE